MKRITPFLAMAVALSQWPHLSGCSETTRTDELHFGPAAPVHGEWELRPVGAKRIDATEPLTGFDVWSAMELSVVLTSEHPMDDTTLTLEAACRADGRVFSDRWTGPASEPEVIHVESNFTFFLRGLQANPDHCDFHATLDGRDTRVTASGCLFQTDTGYPRFLEHACLHPLPQEPEGVVRAGHPDLMWAPEGRGQRWYVFRAEIRHPPMLSALAPTARLICTRPGAWKKDLGEVAVTGRGCPLCTQWQPLTFVSDLAEHGLVGKLRPHVCLAELRPARGAAPIQTWCWRQEAGFGDGDAGCEELMEGTSGDARGGTP